MKILEQFFNKTVDEIVAFALVLSLVMAALLLLVLPVLV